MYIDQQDAKQLMQAAQQVITQLQKWRPDFWLENKVENENITHDIIDLEYQLERLEKAIQNDPTKYPNG